MTAELIVKRPVERVLVVGRTITLPKVTSCTWTDANKPNLSDFDAVVVDLGKLSETVWNDEAYVPPLDQWARFLFGDHIELVVIGNPMTPFAIPGLPSAAAAWEILPYFPAVIEQAISTARIQREELRNYLERATPYRFQLRSDFGNATQQLGVFCDAASPSRRADRIEPSLKEVAATRTGTLVAAELEFEASRDNQHIGTSVPVLWLPSPTDGALEALRALLLSRYRLADETPAPSWSSAYALPKEAEVHDTIAEIEGQMAALGSQLEERRDALDHESRFGQLLYEQGTPLERIVREALAVLGASVTEPERPGGDDGRFMAPDGTLGVLEIKGTGRSVSRDHLRQLHDWVTEAEASDDDWEGVGVLVANTYRADDPSERDVPLPDDAERLAKRWGQVVLATDQIYVALRQQQEGTLNASEWWAAVMASRGLCPVPGLRQP